MLCRYSLEDATLQGVANELGISKECVRRIRETAEKKFREVFAEFAVWHSLATPAEDKVSLARCPPPGWARSVSKLRLAGIRVFAE